MDKIVGKIGATILCVLAQMAFAHVELSVKDLDGNQIKQAAVGVPFTLEVSVSGAGRAMQQPTIKGIESFPPPHSTNMSVVMINGQTTIKHLWQYQLDKPGSYTIGPAEVSAKGATLSSNVITLEVGQQQINTVSQEKKKDQRVAFLQLVTAKDHLVVGESASYSIRFFYLEDIELKNIGEPDVTHLKPSQPIGPFGGKMQVDGVEYKVMEWRCEFCPRAPGEILIPAHSVDFEQPQPANAMFGFFNFGRGQIKRSYSNSLKFTVDPLPEPAESIDGVGSFTKFEATLKPAMAKEGEGMVLAITLEGNGAQCVQEFALQMPESFKWYDSKNYVVDPQAATPTKIFEFIVQGLKLGNWEIPAQHFNFYDPVAKKYKSLETAPISVSILEGGRKAVTVEPLIEHTSVVEDEPMQPDSLRRISTYCAGSGWRALPWPFFILLVLVPLLPPFGRFINRHLRARAINQQPSNAKKSAAKRARTLLFTAAKHNDTKQLYGIMRKFLADRLAVAESTISADYIEQILQTKKVSPEHIAQWNAFFNQITEQFYYPEQKTDASATLFKQAHSWIERLEKITK